MHQDLQLKQVQRLALTPELVQSIKILQMNTVELEDYINDALLGNPLLEKNEPEGNGYPYDASLFCCSRAAVNTDSKNETIDNYADSSVSLADFLHEQFRFLSGLSQEQKRIGVCLIDSLDENGYFTDTPRSR